MRQGYYLTHLPHWVKAVLHWTAEVTDASKEALSFRTKQA